MFSLEEAVKNIELLPHDRFKSLKNYKQDILENAIANLNYRKELYLEAYRFLLKKKYLNSAQNSLSRYLAYKCSEIQKEMLSKSTKEVENLIEPLKYLIEESAYSKIFTHYLETWLILTGHKVASHQNNKLFNQIKNQLDSVGWLSKQELYADNIEEIVKLCLSFSYASIVIISNQGSANCIAALKSIYDQNKDLKIIFVSNNKNNQVEDILELVDTFIQMKENKGAYLARNIGALFASSEILIFMEDDGIAEKGFIEEHISLHQDENIVSIRGCYLTRTNGNMPSHYWLGSNVKKSAVTLEGNCSFKSKGFYQVGGWGDYILFGHGGPEISYRMIKSISNPSQHIYNPKAVLYHDYIKEGRDINNKKSVQYASWQLLKFHHTNFHTIFQKWK